MTKRYTPGTKQLATELDAGLVDEFKAFCRGRDETVRKHLEMAIRRHLGNPPPPPGEVPPLPPVTVPVPTTTRKKTRKGK